MGGKLQAWLLLKTAAISGISAGTVYNACFASLDQGEP
jgi:hypothetical protein